MSPHRKSGPRTFVKSAGSDVPVDRSVQAIKDLVRKYGASGFGTSEDYERGIVTVSFVLNTEDGQHVPVQIPVRIGRVYELLYQQPRKSGGDSFKNDPDVQRQRRDRAEMVAWRQLHLLVEANLTAVQLGVMSLGEAFLAHTLVVSDDGRSERMADYLTRTAGALGSGVRALLAAPRSEP